MIPFEQILASSSCLASGQEAIAYRNSALAASGIVPMVRFSDAHPPATIFRSIKTGESWESLDAALAAATLYDESQARFLAGK